MSGQVRVGIACFLFNQQGQYLLMERTSPHGIGTWGLQGGHQEFGEAPQETVVREVLEEVGIAIDPASLVWLGYTNDFMPESGKHYLTMFFGYELSVDAKPYNAEPHKVSALEWWNGGDSRKLFSPLQNFVDQNPDPYALFRQLAGMKQKAA